MNKVKGSLERLIKRYELLYDMYARLTGLDYEKPNKNHDLFSTGFSRSGNTFAVNIIKEAFPGIRLVSHIHTISSIKTAAKYNIPILVHFRNPLDTIISVVIKRKESNPNISIVKESRLAEAKWVEYYSYSLKKSNELFLINFDLLTNHTNTYVTLVNKTIAFPNFIWDGDQAKLILESMYNKDKRSGGSKNLRTPEKQIIIDEYKSLITESLHLNEAIAIFEQLKKSQLEY